MLEEQAEVIEIENGGENYSESTIKALWTKIRNFNPDGCVGIAYNQLGLIPTVHMPKFYYSLVDRANQNKPLSPINRSHTSSSNSFVDGAKRIEYNELDMKDFSNTDMYVCDFDMLDAELQQSVIDSQSDLLWTDSAIDDEMNYLRLITGNLCINNNDQNKDSSKSDATDHCVQLLSPEFLHPAPPILEVSPDELNWLQFSEEQNCQLYWDCSLVEIEVDRALLKDLLTAAAKSSLNPKQQQQLIAKIKADSEYVLTSEDINISPTVLTSMVENNSLVAVEILLQLIRCKHEKIDVMDYLNALANMNISFHSIEVVNGLSAVTDLPKEFIHLYISNCISSCENINDKFMQSRFVRLVCVLLQV